MTTTNWRERYNKKFTYFVIEHHNCDGWRDWEDAKLDGKTTIEDNELMAFIDEEISSAHQQWVEEVVGKLTPYLEHGEHCKVRWEIDDEECDCGLDAAILVVNGNKI